MSRAAASPSVFEKSRRIFAMRLILFNTGTRPESAHSISDMTKYRFVTPNRAGKWYSSLEQAQRFAEKIGAGFFERMTRRFVAYKDTRLESAEFAD